MGKVVPEPVKNALFLNGQELGVAALFDLTGLRDDGLKIFDLIALGFVGFDEVLNRSVLEIFLGLLDDLAIRRKALLAVISLAIFFEIFLLQEGTVVNIA